MFLIKIPDVVFVALTALSAALLITPDALLEIKEFIGIAGVLASIGIQIWKARQDRIIKREIEEIRLQNAQFKDERKEFRREIRGEVEELKKQVSSD